MRRPARPLRSLQVEVTSRCVLACGICPRKHVAGWQARDLDDEAWTRLERDLALASDVHLQGWGEPLLDGRLRERVRAAHAAGCTVGLTTSGTSLTDAAGWLAAEGVERVAVSVGPGRSSGLAPEDVWEGVAALAAARRHGRPRVLVSAMVDCDAAAVLPALVGASAEAGADEVYCIHVDCTPTRPLLERAAFAGGELRPGIADAIEAASAAARRASIAFRPPTLRADDLLVCALDPCRFVFVSSDGRIGPCVNMLLPTPGPLTRWDHEGRHIVEPEVWGRLPADSLGEALAARQAAFVRPFAARLAAERTFRATAGDGWGPPALRALEEADARRSAALAAAPFPAACAGCHKARGW